MTQTTVSICKGDGEDIEARVRRAISLLGGMGKYVKSGYSVMLKPNVTGPAPFEAGITTHPLVLEAVLKMVLEAGAGSVLIADGTGSATLGTRKVFDACGYSYLEKKYQGRFSFMDLNREPLVAVQVENPYILEKINIAKPVLQCDAVINLPVMKTHFITGVSLCMKNMKGCIPPAEKRLMHDLGVNKAVADLSSLLSPTLNIVDGVIGSEGLGPKEGHPVGLGLIVAGEDEVAVDTVCCDIMGFDAREIEHIRLAHMHGKGIMDKAAIRIVGDSVKSVRHPFAPATPKIPKDGAAEIINGSACSGCISCAVIAQSRLIDSGLLEALKKRGIKLAFAIGPKLPSDGWTDTENTFVIGNCAKGMADKGVYIPGCAPACLDVNRIITERYGLDDSALESLIGDVDK